MVCRRQRRRQELLPLKVYYLTCRSQLPHPFPAHPSMLLLLPTTTTTTTTATAAEWKSKQKVPKVVSVCAPEKMNGREIHQETEISLGPRKQSPAKLEAGKNPEQMVWRGADTTKNYISSFTVYHLLMSHHCIFWPKVLMIIFDGRAIENNRTNVTLASNSTLPRVHFVFYSDKDRSL